MKSLAFPLPNDALIQTNLTDELRAICVQNLASTSIEQKSFFFHNNNEWGKIHKYNITINISLQNVLHLKMKVDL